MKSLIEFLYSLFIGIAVALFVGFGIWAFYPGPELPRHPSVSHSVTGELSEEDMVAQKEFDKSFEDYQKQEKDYSLRVAMIALMPAILFFVGGLRFMKSNDVVGEGLAIGGILTAIYALIRSSSSQHRVMVFVGATVLLTMVVILAQAKFRPEKSKSTK